MLQTTAVMAKELRVKTLLLIDVLASSPATDRDGKQAKTKEGKDLFELAVLSEKKKRIAGQEFTTTEPVKIKSEVLLTKGIYLVEAMMFVIEKDVFWRVIKIHEQGKGKVA